MIPCLDIAFDTDGTGQEHGEVNAYPDRNTYRPRPRGAPVRPHQLLRSGTALVGPPGRLLGAVCLALRRRPALPMLVVAVVTLGIGASLFFLSWLGSAYELARHGVPAVQLLRVGSLVLVVALADALAVGARHGSTSATDRSEPRASTSRHQARADRRRG
jgi:hypothetical protein